MSFISVLSGAIYHDKPQFYCIKRLVNEYFTDFNQFAGFFFAASLATLEKMGIFV
jgi:hypothetical protein